MSKTNDTHKTNDTPKLGHGMLEDHGTLADSELGAVTGGTTAKGSNSWLLALAKAMGKAEDAAAARRITT